MANYHSKGTLLKMGDGASPETFTTVGQVQDISGPSLSLGTVEVTNHSSTAREFVADILGGGEVSFEIVYDPNLATHKNASGGLLYALAQKQRKNWKLTLPSSPSADIAFTGWVTKFESAAPVEGKLAAKVTITCDGLPTMP